MATPAALGVKDVIGAPVPEAETLTDDWAEMVAVAGWVEALDAAATQEAFWAAQKEKLAPGAVTQALFWFSHSLAVEAVALARQDACWAAQEEKLAPGAVTQALFAVSHSEKVEAKAEDARAATARTE